jgi:sugar phosphate isomerase/epimerase
VKFAICNEIFEGWTIDDTIRRVAEIGYNGLEIAPFTLEKNVNFISAAERLRIRDLAANAGISISGIHWVLVQTEGLHLTHPDATVRDRTSGYFSDLVEFCGDLGGKYVVVGSPKQRSLMDGDSYEQAWDWATDVFRESVAQAEDRNVVICFEPLAPSETNFINTAEEAIRFVQQLDSPNFKIILDVKAMSAEAKPIPQIIEESWPHFAHFHANDRNLKGPGFGDIDFKPIAAALKKVGYKDFVSVEVFNFEEGAEAIATRSLEYLQRVFADERS